MFAKYKLSNDIILSVNYYHNEDVYNNSGFRRKDRVIKYKPFMVAKRGHSLGVPYVENGNWGRE